MILPSIELVVAINASVRHNDEWFDEEDNLDRIGQILIELQTAVDPLVAAAVATKCRFGPVVTDWYVG